MSIGKIPDNVINLLAIRELKQREKAEKKKFSPKKAAGLKIKEEEESFEVLALPEAEIIETPQIIEPELDRFSVEYALRDLQEKMQKAQNQCLTSFEIYQKFMLETNGFAEILEERLYTALHNYTQVRQQYIQLARQASKQLQSNNLALSAGF